MKPREWWIDPEYDGYFDDMDENLIIGGFVKAIEKSAYDALNDEFIETVKEREHFTAQYDIQVKRNDALLKSNAELLRALEEILHASNMATLGKWDDTEIMKNLAYKALTEYAELMRTSE